MEQSDPAAAPSLGIYDARYKPDSVLEMEELMGRGSKGFKKTELIANLKFFLS